MGVVVVARDALEGGADLDGIAVGQVVAGCGADLLITSLELAAAGHVADRPEVNESAAVVPIHHDIHLLQVAMHQSLLGEEEQRHAHILQHLHLPTLGQSAFTQVIGVIL